MMGYLANTLIFILVGVVIMEEAFNNVTGKDVLYLVSVYIGILVIRYGTVQSITRLNINFTYCFTLHLRQSDRQTNGQTNARAEIEGNGNSSTMFA